MARRKDVLLVRKTGPYCTILLKIKEQKKKKCQRCKGRGQNRICNTTQRAFGTLAPLTQIFECDEHLCTSKHGEGHEPS